VVTRDGSMTLCINPKCQRPENSAHTVFCQNCGSELLLEGTYRVESVLGSGGFGKTFEVSSKDGHARKVLKVLINPMDKAVELFKREAEVLAKLNHPGIPRVEADGYFVYFPRNAEAPLHCLIMEKIEGLDLQEYIHQRNHRPVNQKLVLQWMIEIVQILEMVHSQNFFHRDIKPSNVMLRNDGRLALIDFGTAREVTGTYMAKQEARGVTGIISAGYTPVEQLNGQAIQQSDFYALGRTMSYLLTAKEPSEIYDAVTDEFPWMQFAPHVHDDFADFLDQMMARIPKYRPPNTQSILQSLNQISQFVHAQDPVIHPGQSLPGSPNLKPSPPPPLVQPISSPNSPYPEASQPLGLSRQPFVSAPIASPNERAASHQESGQGAGFLVRTIAAAIDLSILGLTTVTVGIFIGQLTQGSHGGDAAYAAGYAIGNLIVLVHPVMTWLYYAVLHSSKRQATFGKRMMGLQVISLNGARISFGKATVRFMCQLLSAITVIGYPMALFNQQKQSLHDVMAETLVIKRC
jgi:eukaryotic-like serine/threonine-protein kinase